MVDKKNIDAAYRSLRKAVELAGNCDKEGIVKIRKALDMAINAYGDKLTITGEPLIIHSINVAKMVVVEMGLGVTSIVTALLHDSSDSQGVDYDYIKNEFGLKAVEILKGLSRISNIDSMQSTYQAENFKKLLLSLADDIRVILIKLVERLEYMRLIDRVPEKERLPLASETYFLYAPLAHRLGFYSIKSEMEDQSVKILEPDQYKFIEERLKQTMSSRNRYIKEFIAPLQIALEKQSFNFHIKGRTKSIHSIMRKMKKQGVTFEEVYDLFAIRIILDSIPENEKSDCWRAYSIVADLYQPNPSRLRDWLSVPKSNGYESLHTTVVGPRGRWVEVQIRTERMDEIAERGLAAHFKYKGVKGEGGLDIWISRMREILESTEKEDRAFLDQVKSGLYSDEVFVFTPKGDLRQLPIGSTVLDFAFDIHTDVGTSCVGGKVNGKNVTIKHILNNGDHVDIIRSKNQKPKQDWLNFVVTNKAKSKIKQVLNEEKVKAAAEGKEILTRRLKNWKIGYGDMTVQKLLNHYNLKLAQDLYYMIAIGKIEPLEIKNILIKQVSSVNEQPLPYDPSIKESIKESSYSQSADYLIIENKVEGLDYKLAKCCNPVFGDPIFGFVTISEGIKIHRKGCPNANNLLARYPYRIIGATWTSTKSLPSFLSSIKISGIEEVGIVNRIDEVLKSFNISVRSFSYKMDDGLFEGVLNITVANNDVLYGAIRRIQSLKGILKVTRTENQ
jgi:GTP pyrophosphokinase